MAQFPFPFRTIAATAIACSSFTCASSQTASPMQDSTAAGSSGSGAPAPSAMHGGHMIAAGNAGSTSSMMSVGSGGAASGMTVAHGGHLMLPPARPMLAVEPWDGSLQLGAFEDTNPDANIVEVSLTAAPAQVEYIPGHPTTVWAYNGTVPGPVLRAKIGDRVIVHLKNALPDPTTIHWHGVRVPAAMDGTAAMQSPVQPGGTFDYEFVALDAGTFWFHPHIQSDKQVEHGLYGAIVVEDPAEPMSDMPGDVMMLSDVMVDPATFQLDDSTDDRMMMMGHEGNLVLVNGKRSNMRVSVRAGEPHRLRLVNAASARFFDVKMTGGTMIRIGGDRGLLESPETVDHLLLVNGERADLIVWVNKANTSATLQAIPHERAMGAGATTATNLVTMTASSADALPPPKVPSVLKSMEPGAAMAGTRKLRLSEVMMHGQVLFLINGAAYPNVPVVTPKLGTSETWQIVNESAMDHPFHMHGFFFQPVGRREWKDTINVPGNQTIEVMPNFDDRDGAAGRWMYHCHILKHAELGMMGEMDVR